MNRTGLVLYHGIQTGPELKQYGRIAEACGYESLWVTERYFHEEIFSLLGYLGAATETIKLGVGVTNPYTRHPALLAMAAATLDRITGGRFVMGLGRSERDVIQGRMGMSYGDAPAVMSEAVSLMKALLGAKKVSRSEGNFKIRDTRLATLPVQSDLPIYLAAIGNKGLDLAGTIADGVVLNAYVPPAYVEYAVSRIRKAAVRAGRDPKDIDIACMVVIRLTNDPGSMMPTLKKRIVRLLSEPYVGEILLEKGGFDDSVLPAIRRSFVKDDGDSAKGLITDEMVESFYVIGDERKCKARVEAYRRAGVDVPLILPRLEDYERVANALRP